MNIGMAGLLSVQDGRPHLTFRVSKATISQRVGQATIVAVLVCHWRQAPFFIFAIVLPSGSTILVIFSFFLPASLAAIATCCGSAVIIEWHCPI
jgi:hypothetical protein